MGLTGFNKRRREALLKVNLSTSTVSPSLSDAKDITKEKDSISKEDSKEVSKQNSSKTKKLRDE